MTFKNAVESAFKNLTDFQGRASRSEYWWFVLFYVIVSFVVGIVDAMLFGANSGLLGLLVVLGLFIPSLSLAFRRLHDTERTAWWILINFIPLIGFFIYLYFVVQKGTDGANKYGADPLG